MEYILFESESTLGLPTLNARLKDQPSTSRKVKRLLIVSKCTGLIFTDGFIKDKFLRGNKQVIIDFLNKHEDHIIGNCQTRSKSKQLTELYKKIFDNGKQTL